MQSKHSGSVLIGQCRQNNTDPIFAVIIRIANGDVVELLTKNEKGFEEGIRGFFFFRLQTRDFSQNFPLMFFSLRTPMAQEMKVKESSAPFEGLLLKLTCA